MKYIGQDGYVHVLGENELMHYNHNHDKLGRFASSGSSAGSTQRALRKLEKHRVMAYGREMKATVKAQKTKAKLHTGYDNPATKQRYKDLEAKRKEYEKQRKETEAFINKAISNAEKNGYTVSSKEKYRSSQRGEDFVDLVAQNALLGIAGNAIGSTVKYKSRQVVYRPQFEGQTPSHVRYDKYKVRKPKKSK